MKSTTFSPDGRWVVTASADHTVRVWEASNGREHALLRGHTNAVYSAAFSPDGRWVVTTSDDKTARVWEASSGREHALLRGHTNAVYSAVFSPDGRWVVTTSAGNTARMWEASSGREHALLQGHTAAVNSAAFSPDGRWVVTASADKTARRYIIDLDELLEVANDCVNRRFTVEERVRYLGESYWQVKGEEHLAEGAIEKAVEAFAEAERQDPQLVVPAETWNDLCRLGSLLDQAAIVQAACERAVTLAPEDGLLRDSRGLNRARRGNYPGAIADFQFYITWARKHAADHPKAAATISSREAWIQELTFGRNPFTPDVLAALRPGTITLPTPVTPEAITPTE